MFEPTDHFLACGDDSGPAPSFYELCTVCEQYQPEVTHGACDDCLVHCEVCDSKNHPDDTVMWASRDDGSRFCTDCTEHHDEEVTGCLEH